MKRITRAPRHRITPWQRWCIIVTIVSPDRETAERRLALSRVQLSKQLNDAMRTLNVTTLMHAAMKLKLLVVNFDELGDWFQERNVKVSPGVSLDLEGWVPESD